MGQVISPPGCLSMLLKKAANERAPLAKILHVHPQEGKCRRPSTPSSPLKVPNEHELKPPHQTELWRRPAGRHTVVVLRLFWVPGMERRRPSSSPSLSVSTMLECSTMRVTSRAGSEGEGTPEDWYEPSSPM